MPESAAVGTDVLKRASRPALRFSLAPQPEIAPAENVRSNGSLLPPVERAIRVRIMDGFPKPQNSDSEAGVGGGTTAIASNTGEYFTVAITQGNEELERYEHLSMNPQAAAEVADYAVTALQRCRNIRATDISLTSSPLARRPANGIYEVSPPPVQVQPERFSQYVEGVRDDRTGVRGLFEIDDVTIVSCPDLMKVSEVGLMNLDQVHGVMDMHPQLSQPGRPHLGGSHPRRTRQYRMALHQRPPFDELYREDHRTGNPVGGV